MHGGEDVKVLRLVGRSIEADWISDGLIYSRRGTTAPARSGIEP